MKGFDDASSQGSGLSGFAYLKGRSSQISGKAHSGSSSSSKRKNNLNTKIVKRDFGKPDPIVAKKGTTISDDSSTGIMKVGS